MPWKKAVLEAAALKHFGRWHKTNIEEELMKARAFIAASGAFKVLKKLVSHGELNRVACKLN